DMPLLPVALLQELLRHPEGAFFSGHPLPAYLRSGPLPQSVDRVYALHRALGSRELPLPATTVITAAMSNINTPQEWAALRTLNPSAQSAAQPTRLNQENASWAATPPPNLSPLP
ncbi:hypothetical protein, partial [Thiocapsa imhoffii]